MIRVNLYACILRCYKNTSSKLPAMVQTTKMTAACVLTALFSILVLAYGRKFPNEVPKGSMATGKCRFLINEFNYYPQGAMQFLELRRACDTPPGRVKGVQMTGYVLVFISHDAQLLGVCRLGSPVSKEANRRQGDILFYTIGGQLVENRDEDIENCEFMPRYGVLLHRFPTGDSAPVAVALLYNTNPSILSGVALERNNQNIPVPTYIRFSMQQVIMKNLQDMYVYTSSSPYTSCKYFENYYSEYTLGGLRVLRDYGQYDDDLQMSLSRCKKTFLADVVLDWEPFQPESFKLAKFTPGANNDCEKAVGFIIEELLPARKKPKLDYPPAYACQITSEDEAIDKMDAITNPFYYQDQLRAAVTRHRLQAPEAEQLPTGYEDYFLEGTQPYCAPNPHPLPTSEFLSELQNSAPFIWESCDRFPHNDLINAIKSNEKESPLKMTDILKKDTCNWFEWLPTSKKFRCKLCNRLWNQAIIFDRKTHITKIITVGQGNRGPHAKYDNKKIIERHASSSLHKLAVEFHQMYDQGKRGTDLFQEFYQPGGLFRQFTNKTENRFVSVFQSIKLDLPFFKYPAMSELLEFYNIDMGTLYRNPHGMKDILMSISTKLHKEELEYLKQEKPVFTMLLDASSDVSSQYSLAIVFQTFNKTKQVDLKMYRVLHVDQRETTENLYKMIRDSLVSDGLLDYFKEKCVGFSTDGGSNVRKLHGVLNQITDHDLLYVYCHAHRLERAVHRAWNAEEELEDAERLINTLYTMFNSRSPRKKLLMQQKIRENQDSKFELKPVKKIRWVNSKKRAADTVNKHWKTIVAAVASVETDNTFPKSQRDAASAILEQLKRPLTVATLAFISDSSLELAKVSLNLQDRGGTLIAKKAKREEMKTGLRKLGTEPGPQLASVLSNSIVGEHSPGIPVTLEDFDTKPIILYGIKLGNPSGTPSLQAIFALYIKKLVDQIDEYFPPDPSDNLDVLDPSRWPLNDLKFFGNNEIKNANFGFKWNFPIDSLLAGWNIVKTSVAASPEFVQKRLLRPEDFWAFYLQENVGWTQEMRTIITNIIVVPASTAHVERIYSYYTSIKTMRRYNLDVSTVEAIIRVKVNGPTTVEEFAENAHEYVKIFILSGHMRSDDVNEQTDTLKDCPQTQAVSDNRQIAGTNEPGNSVEQFIDSDSEEGYGLLSDDDDDFGVAAPVVAID